MSKINNDFSFYSCLNIELLFLTQGVKTQGMVAQNVRKVVRCYECNKPRCVYSKQILTIREARAFKRLMEKHDYSCGSLITPEGITIHFIGARNSMYKV